MTMRSLKQGLQARLSVCRGKQQYASDPGEGSNVVVLVLPAAYMRVAILEVHLSRWTPGAFPQVTVLSSVSLQGHLWQA